MEVPECAPCAGFPARFEAHDPADYRNIVRLLIDAVNRGTLSIVYESCPLPEILGATMPGDTLTHDLKCMHCGRPFHLFADTYHGRVSWRPDTLPDHRNEK